MVLHLQDMVFQDMVFQMLLWKVGFYLKKESLGFDVY